MEDLLKEFWPIALFFVISIISYVRNDAKMKQGKKETRETQPHTLDENFPKVEYVETQAAPSLDVVDSRKPLEKKRIDDKKISPKSISAPIHLSEETPLVKRGVKVPFKGKSDVKKAFIYSEILNRKYK